mmetsp:Transcript_19110/g.49641  ORF Transcript_19110/g.49641 Transcript_19110/m.49641 type:complete len:957 (-) Transcript_19110:1046-3916(-)
MPSQHGGVPHYAQSQEFMDAVAAREGMPGLERLQTQYVRYKRFSEAQVSNTGWDLGTSRRNHECMGTSDHHPALYSPCMPEAVSMQIVEAPAEFAMPVKQDRRLNPPFRVRVDVQHRGPLSFPLTLRASLITQQDKDNMLTWSPEDMHEARPITELKGTTNIAHHFEAHAPGGGAQRNGNGIRKGRSASSRAAPTMSPLTHQESGQMEASPAPLGGVPPSGQQWWGRPEQSPAAGQDHGKYMEQLLMQQMAAHMGRGDTGGGTMSPQLSLSAPFPPSFSMPFPGFQPGFNPPPQQGFPPQGFPTMSQGFAPGFQPFNPSLPPGLPLNLGMQQQFPNSPQLQISQLQPHQPPQDHKQEQQEGAQAKQEQPKQEQQQQPLKPQPQQYHAFQPYQGPRASTGSLPPQPPQPTLQPPAPLNLGLQPDPLAQAQQEEEQQDRPMGLSSFEFEFVNIEFLKPTRMNKVYMVFACTIMDLDTLYVAYNVPTIGICRAEQREKACQKLGIPAPNFNYDMASPTYFKEESGATRKGARQRGPGQPPLEPEEQVQSRRGTRLKNQGLQEGSDFQSGGLHSLGLALGHFSGSSQEENLSQQEQELMAMHQLHQLQSMQPMQHFQAGLRKREAGNQLTPVVGEERLGGRRRGGPIGKPQVAAYDMPDLRRDSSEEGGRGPYSRAAMQELILEEYENTGLKRKLTKLDIQALLSQAGFPSDQSSAHAEVSQGQWEEFIAQFRATLDLLRQISSVWNVEDPCVISGFDMDRQGTVQALVNQPSGTFICRFSMSQPGCLVLSCKMAGPEHDNRADMDGLVHAIIHVNDLYERRVDTWIRDFSGATHVLDVYRQKRVDKRKVFTSNYTRLKGSAQMQQPVPALPTTGASPFASMQPLPSQPIANQLDPSGSVGVASTALPLLPPKDEELNDDALMADAAAAAAAPTSAAIMTPPPGFSAAVAVTAATPEQGK